MSPAPSPLPPSRPVASARLRLRDRLAYGLLLAALALIVAGVTLPAFTVSSLWVFERTYSIAGGIFAMAQRGDWLLAGFVGCVSVLLPVGKILIGLVALARLTAPGPRLARTLRVLAALARWSMADVLVLALLVVILNGQVLTTADVHSGIALFALGVAASALGLALVEKRA